MRKRPAPKDELGTTLQAIENAWTEGVALSGALPDPEAEARLSRLLSDVVMVQKFSLALSKGDLAQRLEAKGLMAGSLKSLQANLRHLAWQTQMVAKGDFSQRVYFMGEFSESFNQMITGLAEARSQIERRETELLQFNANLQARNREITLINKMSDALQTCFTWEEAVPAIEHFVQELFPVASGVLFMLDSDKQLMQAVASWGTLRPEAHDVTPHECWAIRHGVLYFGEGLEEEMACCHLLSRLEGFSACLPLQTHERTLGLLRLQAPGELPAGGSEQLKVLAKTVKDQLSLALANISLRETLHHQAIHDPLTDLFNRRYLVETLDREILRAQRKGTSLVVMMLDLDHFKRLNDASGHEAGDRLLQALAGFLKSHIRGGDIACRYGGEEFVLIMPEVSLDVALMRAEQFRLGVSNLQVDYRGQLLDKITISMGVAVYPKDGTTTDDVLKAADEAMYRAKAAGRNRVVLAAKSQ
ncbi:MAG: sensor domain-containing diguanylate cyclase [Desulfobaccales bacterium]